MLETYREILTIEEVMEILDVGKNSVYDLLKSGEVKAFFLKGRWKIPKKAVEEYILSKSSLKTSH